MSWRVGRSVGRTIYLNDRLVGLMDTPELARQVVEALKGQQEMSNQPEPASEPDYSNYEPDAELADRLKRLLAEDHALRALQLEPGVTVIEDEPNVLGVSTVNGEDFFIEVKPA